MKLSLILVSTLLLATPASARKAAHPAAGKSTPLPQSFGLFAVVGSKLTDLPEEYWKAPKLHAPQQFVFYARSLLTHVGSWRCLVVDGKDSGQNVAVRVKPVPGHSDMILISPAEEFTAGNTYGLSRDDSVLGTFKSE